MDFETDGGLEFFFIHFYKLLFSSFILGLIISFAFASGCAVVIVALQHKQGLASKLQRFYEYAGIKVDCDVKLAKKIDCDICGVIKCNRHLSTPNREPWRGLFIIKELDDALASVSVFWSSFYNFSSLFDFLNTISVLYENIKCLRGKLVLAIIEK